jgi:hypothetical protein
VFETPVNVFGLDKRKKWEDKIVMGTHYRYSSPKRVKRVSLQGSASGCACPRFMGRVAVTVTVADQATEDWSV